MGAIEEAVETRQPMRQRKRSLPQELDDPVRKIHYERYTDVNSSYKCPL